MRLFLPVIGLMALAACGDPMAQFQRLAEQDIPGETVTADAVARPEAEEGGLLSRLLRNEPEGGTDDLAAAIAADVAGLPAEPQAAPEGEETPSRGGLFALLRGNSERDGAEPTPASLTPEAEPRTRGGGLLGLGNRKTPALPETVTSEIAPGTVLPYGRVARICGLSKREMGKEIAQYPEQRPVHRIYDSDPGNTAPHSFFITGFDDGCARQFTASLAMFGSVEMHEKLRYGLPAKVQPYSDTDKAYEKLKSGICRVGYQKPCGSKLPRLKQSTVFVSIYERFGSNPSWTNLLIHDGSIVAQDKKKGG